MRDGLTPEKWRVLIADDEPTARRGVRQLLAAHPDYEVVGESRDGREVLAALDLLAPDVIFLDVQMPEGNAFDVIRRRTAERMPAMVFLTAFSQFALPAFDVAAIDYLVKPVSASRFATTIKRLTKRLEGGAAGTPEPRLMLTTSRGVQVIPLREIDWIEAADYYARVWVGARSYLLRDSLAQLESRVAGHGFVRVHRQALIRLECVRALRTTDDGDVVAVLTSGARVPVSRRRRAAFVAALKGRTQR